MPVSKAPRFEIITCVTEAMRDHGWRKKGLRWSIRKDTAAMEFWLRGSPWNKVGRRRYDLGLDVEYDCLAPYFETEVRKAIPAYHKSEFGHARIVITNAEDFALNFSKYKSKNWNFNDTYTEDSGFFGNVYDDNAARRRMILDDISRIVLPLSKRIETIEQLLEFYAAGTLGYQVFFPHFFWLQEMNKRNSFAANRLEGRDIGVWATNYLDWKNRID